MTDLPQLLPNRDLERLRTYQDNLDFYNGVQWPGSSSRRERRLTFNYARVFVDKITSYLMSGMTFAVNPSLASGKDDSTEQKALAQAAEYSLHQVYDDNDLQALDYDTETDCAVLGDAAYKVIWDPLDKKVRITAPDVQGIYCWWLGDDVSRLYRLASRYTLEPDQVEMLYGIQASSFPPSGRITIIEDWTAQTFTLYIDGQAHRSAKNPYGFIPFIVFPNLRRPKQFWGVSDLPPIMETQRELNRALSQLSRILELSGNPIAVLENVDSSEDIAVQPGAVWTIPEDAKAYLLDLLQGGGIRLHISYIDTLYRAMHDLSESPRAAFGGTPRDLSGVALQVELYSLLQKVSRKRVIRTSVYKRRNDMVLKLLARYAGLPAGPAAAGEAAGLTTRVVWGSILPDDLMRRVQAHQTMVNAGLASRRRAMTDLGILDPEFEFNQWLEEKARIDRQEGLDLIER